jgi:pimeloyl-ACP methyl ester carboxylesterase
MVASKSKDIDFIVLLAGSGVDGGKILETQKKRISIFAGLSEQQIEANDKLTKEIHKIVKNAKNVDEVKKELTDYFKNHPEIPANTKQQYVDAYSDNWLMNFVKINPQDYLKQVTCPILALNGSKDIQVLPKINLEAIRNATAKNKSVTIKKIKGVNHLFQTCTTGNINEYAKIDETISPEVLQIIANWIKIIAKN